jgi:hemerythrin
MLVKWSNDFSVNIAEVDDQHKKLVRMINELHEAMKLGKGREILDRILNNMVDYAKVHFATEERLMKQYSYPGYLNHKAEHDLFVKKVSEFYEEFQQGRISAIDVMNFLKDWLVKHILGSDKKYGPFLNSKGVF